MKKGPYLLPMLVLLIFVPWALAQDMGQDGQGWQGGQGRQGRGMRGTRGMGGDMGGMGGGMDGMGGGMRGMGGGMRGMGGDMGGMGGGRGMGGDMGGMGGGRGMGGGMSPEQMQLARMQRMQAMLRSIDTNGNGQIDPEEAQGPNAFMLDRILRQSGIEPKYPMPLSKIQEAMNSRFRGINGPASPSPTPEKSAEETKPAESTGTPLVPGFGVTAEKLPAVPGFGVLVANATDSAKKGGASSDSSSASTTSTSPVPPLDDRIRQYAKSLMKQYDKNSNGQLEKDEWSEMKGDMKAADKNGDGVITLDELTEKLALDSGSGPKQSSGGAMASSAASSSGGSGGKSGKPKFRQSTPTDRLPKDIPSWFITADTDGDGQVSMAEYTKSKGDSETAAKEFAQSDLNNDGVITPQECLKTLKKK